MKMHKSMIVACLFLAGCGAKTPEEVVRAWAGAMRDGDAEDVMYYALQDQKQPRFDLKNKAQIVEFERNCKHDHQDRWGGIKKGHLFREFVHGDHAWVIVGKKGVSAECFELYRFQGKWKVMDPDYAAYSVSHGTK